MDAHRIDAMKVDGGVAVDGASLLKAIALQGKEFDKLVEHLAAKMDGDGTIDMKTDSKFRSIITAMADADGKLKEQVVMHLIAARIVNGMDGSETKGDGFVMSGADPGDKYGVN
jgi:hypothetical protein